MCCIFTQEIKDIYLFGIVAVLLVFDIVFMIPTTAVSSAILRREERELEGANVSNHKNCYTHFITIPL